MCARMHCILHTLAGSRLDLIFRYIVLSIKINAVFVRSFFFSVLFSRSCHSIIWQRRQRQPDLCSLLLHRLQVLLLMLTKNIITLLRRSKLGRMRNVKKKHEINIYFFLLKLLTNIHCMLWTILNIVPSKLKYFLCEFCILHFFDKKNKIQRFNENRRMKKKKKICLKKRTRLCITMPCTQNIGTTQSTRSTKNCDESTVKYVRLWFRNWME